MLLFPLFFSFQIKTGDLKKQVVPSDHAHVLCTYHQANKDVINKAIEVSLAAKERWEALPWEQRASVFLKVLFVQCVHAFSKGKRIRKI